MPDCFAGVIMEFLLYLALGACAGVLAGLFGVGGGIIIVPVLVFSFTLQGFDASVLTHLAVGTSLATIIFTSINAIREHHRRGAVQWVIVGWMTLGILVGAAIGAKTASLIQGPMLQKIIGVFALIISVQMALDLKPKASRGIPGKFGLGVAGTFMAGRQRFSALVVARLPCHSLPGAAWACSRRWRPHRPAACLSQYSVQ